MSYYRPTSGPPLRGGSAPPPQIPGGGLYPNPMQMQQPQLGFMNPQLLNPNNNNSGNNGGFNNMNMNMNNLGVFQGLQQPFQPQQRGFCPPNSGQFGGWQQNQGQQLGGLTLNPLQVAALNQLVGVVNQAAQSMLPQNAGFVGLQQQQQQAGFGQQLPVIPQQFQNVPVVPWNPTAPQNNQPWNLQGNMQGLQSNTGHNQNKMFMKAPPKEASNWKSKKLNGYQVHNSKGKLQSSNSNKGKGIKQADNENSANKTKGEKRRPLFLLYTKKEVEKWRQDRKKNYPTKDNVQKKLLPKQPNIDGADEDAKLRRQQLKEVIAKQVELGFEVPEIPSHYLSDSQEQFNSKDRKKRPRDQKKSNKRGRGRFEKTNRLALQRSTEDDGSGRGQIATNQKEDDKTPTSRQPTLLQKLLGTDMKRDKNRLLQAFRFMVMNSFFMDQTEKRLHFPEVVVEEEGEITD